MAESEKEKLKQLLDITEEGTKKADILKERVKDFESLIDLVEHATTKDSANLTVDLLAAGADGMHQATAELCSVVDKTDISILKPKIPENEFIDINGRVQNLKGTCKTLLSDDFIKKFGDAIAAVANVYKESKENKIKLINALREGAKTYDTLATEGKNTFTLINIKVRELLK